MRWHGMGENVVWLSPFCVISRFLWHGKNFELVTSLNGIFSDIGLVSKLRARNETNSFEEEEARKPKTHPVTTKSNAKCEWENGNHAAVFRGGSPGCHDAKWEKGTRNERRWNLEEGGGMRNRSEVTSLPFLEPKIIGRFWARNKDNQQKNFWKRQNASSQVIATVDSQLVQWWRIGNAVS